MKIRYRAELKKRIEQVVNSPSVAPRLHRFNRRKTAFLGYHGVFPEAEPAVAWTLVSASSFRRQMQHINQCFDCISIEEALTNDAPRRSKPAAVVTFDDGYANNLKVALPILEAYHIPAVVYVTTGNVVARELFWPDVIWMVASNASPLSVDLSDLGAPLSRYDLSAEDGTFVEEILRLLEDVKKIPARLRKSVVVSIAEKFDTTSRNQAPYPAAEGHIFTPLTTEEVAILSRHPLITIGAHTHCHNLLDQIPLHQARDTIIRSKKVLEEITGVEIRHFAYPNGNFNDAIIDVVKAAGFRSAITFDPGFFSAPGDPFRIKRFGVGADMALDTFKAKLTGIFELRRR